MTRKNAKQMVSEQDEFLLSRLLDDELPADQAQALRERMAREPALAEAYAALRRMHGLLAQRRSDQPCVDYDRFRADLMKAVKTQPVRSGSAGGRPLRFPSWLRIGVPLAAAAMIALVVWVQPGLVRQPEVDSGGKGGPLAKNTPAHSDQPAARDTDLVAEAPPGAGLDQPAESGLAVASPRFAVRFNRPEVREPRPSPTLRVDYARSDQLAEAIQRQDQAGRERSPRYVLLAGSSARRVSVPQDLGELPPL